MTENESARMLRPRFDPCHLDNLSWGICWFHTVTHYYRSMYIRGQRTFSNEHVSRRRRIEFGFIGTYLVAGGSKMFTRSPRCTGIPSLANEWFQKAWFT